VNFLLVIDLFSLWLNVEFLLLEQHFLEILLHTLYALSIVCESVE